MMSNLAVSITMAVIFLLIVVWDVALALDGRRGNTISARVRDWDRRFGGLKLLISMGMGLLAGHWWW
jgi:hypothetical protein